MKSKYKYVLFGASGLLVLVLVAILGLRTLVVSIANQRTCEWANIDNIEINAKINIPSIIDSDCVYLESINTKKAYFEFNLADFDGDHYIEVNKFKNLESKHTEFDFINFNIDSLTIDVLYYKSKKGKKSNSYALFDKNKGVLWVSIQYFD
jgi:lipopolysaccharide export LptBFGC system permease protein LptF